MNTEKHIVSSFDRDLEGVQATLMKMGGLVEAFGRLPDGTQYRFTNLTPSIPCRNQNSQQS